MCDAPGGWYCRLVAAPQTRRSFNPHLIVGIGLPVACIALLCGALAMLAADARTDAVWRPTSPRDGGHAGAYARLGGDAADAEATSTKRPSMGHITKVSPRGGTPAQAEWVPLTLHRGQPPRAPAAGMGVND